MSERQTPRKGDRYRHWKNGHVYVVDEVSKDESDSSMIRVIYEREDGSDEIPWSRTLEDFFSIIPAERVVKERGGQLLSMERFEKLPGAACLPRPKIVAFARTMEEKLRLNDHKGGWDNLRPEDLLDRLEEETDELWQAVKEARIDEGRVIEEAADVANYAMFVADVISRRVAGGIKA